MRRNIFLFMLILVSGFAHAQHYKYIDSSKISGPEKYYREVKPIPTKNSLR
jgi:D-alanyl-D-alanine dipeptidase